jgi:hypothetical protein
MITADELRRAAWSLPEAEERETWGHPTFRVRDKLFASLSDDGRSAGIKTTKEEQTALVATAPGDVRGPGLRRPPRLGQRRAGHRRPGRGPRARDRGVAPDRPQAAGRRL